LFIDLFIYLFILLQIHQKVLEAKDTDKILEETRGNKTRALNLQRSAELASQRAAAIHSGNFLFLL
jgi:hypothetical protein